MQPLLDSPSFSTFWDPLIYYPPSGFLISNPLWKGSDNMYNPLWLSKGQGAPPGTRPLRVYEGESGDTPALP